ncbi:glycoside hydrolase family 27 protein [Coniophora puteana RWD-64-598 SS2]|uniref:Alpha-galactosidase n=1 Tax=Coniophora puteana (strain RWD-64-598) TaxID=741705 RepID=A0A5M3MHI9_CONPW|nr:glycoside hydrolase family 27 protein [Coniophora puteana RWD-64-598 SS2]EIW78699.1 glycoside hydrolase family 27 protein [Coniophora puteana RWD-64-598 SS2]
MIGAAALLVYASAALALNNDVAKLPVLGYNTWNAYHCDISQELVLQQAQYMKTLGLLDAGYTQFNLDDCWGVTSRSSSGEIQYNMNNYTATLNSIGFKAGIYSDSGWQTCAGYMGSFDHEDQDAATFQSWGFDYLKAAANMIHLLLMWCMLNRAAANMLTWCKLNSTAASMVHARFIWG